MTQVGNFYVGPLYRDDLLPVPGYLYRCARAHKLAGIEALTNSWDVSFLGDGISCLRSYLEQELFEVDENPALARASGWNLRPEQNAELMLWLQVDKSLRAC